MRPLITQDNRISLQVSLSGRVPHIIVDDESLIRYLVWYNADVLLKELSGFIRSEKGSRGSPTILEYF